MCCEVGDEALGEGALVEPIVEHVGFPPGPSRWFNCLATAVTSRRGLRSSRMHADVAFERECT